MTEARGEDDRDEDGVRRGLLLLMVIMMTGSVTSASGQRASQRIRLPEPDTEGTVSVEEAVAGRRSVRDFSSRALSLEDVSQLVWAAQGVTGESGKRAAPSAGALYPVELYVVAGRVEGLEPGAYRYRPWRHELERVGTGDLRARLARAALNQRWVEEAPAVLVIAAVYERTSAKYGGRARRYVHMEVGAVAENVYLQAEARGLGTVLVGAFHDDRVADVLGLPDDHRPLGLMPVGHR